MAGRLLASLLEGPRLIVSLPANSPELAEAAAEGGADALKVHLHVEHEASGTQFGGLEEERDALSAILGLELPTGVVPGAGDALPTREEMNELAAMGIDFFDLYARDMPTWLISFDKMTRAIALDEAATPEDVGELESMGFEMLEVAIVPHEGYGRPLSVADLAAYRAIRRATSLPIIVPTQRAIDPGEVSVLVREVGVNSVMIGAIVTGREPEPLRAATEEFAAALAACRAAS
jgi:putative N-acetylmannosamine-6-phosphate epimerase